MAATTFADILKFNPYHDERGRFSTADAATQFTIRTRDPSKQHLAEGGILREKERDAAEAAAAGTGETPQMKAIHDIEDKIRNQNYESAACVDKDGNVLFFKDGEESQVAFNQEECRLMAGNVLTHNHPSSTSFSVEDVDCWLANDMQEIRATNRLGITYSLSRGEDFDKSIGENFAVAFHINRNKALREAQQTLDNKGYPDKIARGEITIDQANAEFRDIFNTVMIDFCTKKAPDYGINFAIEKRELNKSAGSTSFMAKATDGGKPVWILDKDSEAEIDAAFNEWLDSASKDEDGVRKFNPYHDRIGRFTSAGSETSFTYAPGKSTAHDKAIERHKERMAAVAPTEAQEKALKGIESRTRNLKKEQFRVVDREGNVVMQKQGDKTSVSYSVGEARDNFPGNVTIHNHPDGGTFSTPDLSDFGYGATEIRAASPEGTYTLRNLNYKTKWTNEQKGWHDMREDLDAASQGFKSDRQLKKELRGPFDQQVKPIADRWAKRKAEGASDEELSGIAKEYTQKWDELQPQLNKAVRQAYVDQYHHWYKANAGTYGFEYSFTPTQQKTRKSDTMDEFYEPETVVKNTGEIVLDQKMHDDVQDIVNDILSDYPRELTQMRTAKSMDDSRAVLFIGLQISGADALAIDGGEKPEDFHVTLAYGRFDTNGHDEDDISRRVQYAVDQVKVGIPDTIHFDAIGRFPASKSSDGKDVIYAQVAAGQLEESHNFLLSMLKEKGIELEDTFPEYKPHMTLAYIEPGKEYELGEIDATGTTTQLMIGHGWESTKEHNYTIKKMDDDKRLVFGWASISLTAEGEQLEDLQHDLINPEDLEEAVYEYVLNFRDTGEEHRPHLRKKGKLVESCVFTAEKQKAMGLPEGILPVGWWIGFKIEDDEAWEKVKNGTYRMFSIEGKAQRVPVEKAAPEYPELKKGQNGMEKTHNGLIDVIHEVAKADPQRFDHIVEVEKFNPYHDERGRFATANGYASFTIRTKDPSKQHMANAAIAREKERAAAAAAASTSADEGKKRIAEAENNIRSMLKDGAVVKLEGIDPENAEPIQKAIAQVLERYPGTKDAFAGFSTDDPEDQYFADHQSAIACYDPKTQMIHLNKTRYSNRTELEKNYNEAVARKHFPAGTDCDSSVVHEMGHAIDRWVSSKIIPQNEFIWAGERVSRRMWNNDIKNAKKKGEPLTGKSITEGLSRYASSKPAEYLAEGFSEWICSPNPRPMAKSIGKRLETYIKKAEKAGG